MTDNQDKLERARDSIDAAVDALDSLTEQNFATVTSSTLLTLAHITTGVAESTLDTSETADDDESE